MKAQHKKVYSIPAGVPFAQAIAAKLLQDYRARPEELPRVRILLPTRRACRVLREAFLAGNGGAPLLLPRIQPLGDIDGAELSLAIAGAGLYPDLQQIPPALSLLERQLILARLVDKAGELSLGPDQALALADTLGRLLDEVHTQGLDINKLHKLVPADSGYADHWQRVLAFLNIILENWPGILAERGKIDAAQHRDRLIRSLAAHWSKTPPQGPVIAAGSTGSIPAVAELLDVIAALPQGMVVLPGLDTDMDAGSWDAIGDTHPQAGLKGLLTIMGIAREDVKPWNLIKENKTGPARRALAMEIMRPAVTTEQWILLQNQNSKLQQFKAATEDLFLLECGSEREESMTIALLMVETLQQKDRTALLVTPDRALARRVAAACARWGVHIDDSAGTSLDQSPLGGFLQLAVRAAAMDAAPVPLLALLKHRHSKRHAGLQNLERLALRGLSPAPGFAGLRARATSIKDPAQAQKALSVLDQAEAGLAPLLAQRTGKHPFAAILEAHLEACEALATDPAQLWAGDDGAAASAFIGELAAQAAGIGDCTLAQYGSMLRQLMNAVPVRPAYGTHPRLAILGQLEARMMSADLVILGGLNEGGWPPDPGHDPWMSRPMRADFGLPGHDRAIGLAAHDFVQGFCAPRVVLTRALRQNATPTIPARWLQRLEAVLQAAGIEKETLTCHPALEWARALDRHPQAIPCERPGPRPPVTARPRSLSVTKISEWLQDPYGIYARAVLRLEKLDPLEKVPDAATRGTVLHRILLRFVEAHPNDLPADAAAVLENIAQAEIAALGVSPAAWSFWWPRFKRLCTAYLQHETTWRCEACTRAQERRGRLVIPGPRGDFIFTARADRIDEISGEAAVIDYKSGGQYSLSGLGNGEFPQLPVEGLIAQAGGFEDIPPLAVQRISYWILKGGADSITETALTGEKLQEALQAAQEGLKTLVAAFDDPQTPYYSLPRAGMEPRFSDYRHLARADEWGAATDEPGEAA